MSCATECTDSATRQYGKCTANHWMLHTLHIVTYTSLALFAYALLFCVFHTAALPPPTSCYAHGRSIEHRELSLNSTESVEGEEEDRRWRCERGTVFGLYALMVVGLTFGAVVRLIRLPPLFGMLLAGVLLRNLPSPFAVASFVDPDVASALRKLAFTVILLQGGLSLDIQALRRLKGTCLRLAAIPCLVEACSAMVMFHVIFDYPWTYGLLLGFVLGAVSPAICVPSMLAITKQRLGVSKGIPTLVIAASSVDDVIAITGFALVLAVIFSHGNIAWTIAKAPIELTSGLLLGLVFAVILVAMPFRYMKTFGAPLRFTTLLLLALLCMFGSETLNMGGGGAIACLTMAIAVSPHWLTVYGQDDAVRDSMGKLWTAVMEPVMFGLIGAELDIAASINPTSLAQCLLLLAIGIVLRTCAAWISVIGGGLTWRERVFVSIAWLPKATVQAALAPIFLDTVRRDPASPTHMHIAGMTMVSIAVLSIIVTAPLGAALMSLTAPLLLTEDDEECTTKLTNNEKSVDMDANAIELQPR